MQKFQERCLATVLAIVVVVVFHLADTNSAQAAAGGAVSAVEHVMLHKTNPSGHGDPVRSSLCAHAHCSHGVTAQSSDLMHDLAVSVAPEIEVGGPLRGIVSPPLSPPPRSWRS